jgi:hypothetical protein
MLIWIRLFKGTDQDPEINKFVYRYLLPKNLFLLCSSKFIDGPKVEERSVPDH